jgi:putative PIG3 family NAD(P)H quinone oxidoreductase
MRAIFIREPGDESVLTLADRPDLSPQAGHVRVRVKYAGVNRADLLQRIGLYPAPEGSPPDIPGLEYAGVVDAVGEDVHGLGVGDRVFGVVGGGAYADQIVVHEREAARIPDGVSDEHAAAIPEAFVTAYDALVLRAGLRPGERVLVHAVGSGVGTAGLQVAKALGCHVVGTSRTVAKLDRAKGLGLDVGVTVESPGVVAERIRAAHPHDFDVVLDLVGGDYVGETVSLMAPKGRIVLVGLTGGPRTELNLATLLRRRIMIVGTVLRSRPLEEKIQAADLLRRTISPWLARGMIRPVIEAVLPLERACDAHKLVASNATFGKVLLQVP